MTTKINKILLIQTAFLGDVILTTPLIAAIKKVFPAAKLDLVTTQAAAGLFKNDPNLDSVFTFNKKKPLNKAADFLKLVWKIRKGSYDLAFSAQSSFTSSLLMWLGNIPERIGFPRQKLLTRSARPDEKGLHMTFRYLSLLRPFSDDQFDNQTYLRWSDNEQDNVLKVLNGKGANENFRIGIAPGSVWKTKRWPEAYFVDLLKLLKQHKTGIYFLGGPEDRELCSRIIGEAGVDAENLAGKFSLSESAAFIEKLDLMITNDSAPLHIANAVKTDVVAFFGPTVRRFGCYPYRANDRMLEIELACRPCAKHGGDSCPQGHFRCMLDIKPDVAMETLSHYLTEKNSE